MPALQLALERAPTDAGLLALLAGVRNSEGDLDGAEEALSSALEAVDPERRSEILLRLGYLYQDCGRFSEAADRFREVVGDNALHPVGGLPVGMPQQRQATAGSTRFVEGDSTIGA